MESNSYHLNNIYLCLTPGRKGGPGIQRGGGDTQGGTHSQRGTGSPRPLSPPSPSENETLVHKWLRVFHNIKGRTEYCLSQLNLYIIVGLMQKDRVRSSKLRELMNFEILVKN